MTIQVFMSSLNIDLVDLCVDVKAGMEYNILQTPLPYRNNHSNHQIFYSTNIRGDKGGERRVW